MSQEVVRIVFPDLQQKAKEIATWTARFSLEVGRQLYIEGEKIMTDSKENYVPVLNDILRTSGIVLQPEYDKATGAASVTLGFGGQAGAYALAIHEHPSEFDPPSWEGKGTASSSSHEPPTEGVVTFHPTGTGPKYLEQPMVKASKGLTDRVVAAVMRSIKK